MGGLLGAAHARHDGVTTSTHRKTNFHFANWLKFLEKCQLNGDAFLDSYSRIDKQKILGAFLHKVRTKTYSESTKENEFLAASTCSAALSNVCATFRNEGRPNPSLDPDGNTSFLLRRQLKGYTNLDPASKGQKPIPLHLITEMITRQCSEPGLIVFHDLTILAFFFAMRSCEYLLTTGERRTQPLRRRNFVFRRDNKIVPHESPNLHLADSVTLTFEYQKRDLRDDQVTQSKSGHTLLCPVRAAAKVVKRLLSLNKSPDLFTYKYADKKGKVWDLTAKAALAHIRCFIASVDPVFGLKPKEIGLHSLRSSAAMAMYLNGIPVYTIMLLGRWSSDAFLRYIRKQVNEFSNNVSKKMIQNPKYHHLPDPDREDPRTHNPMAATANMGMGASGATINRNVFSVWS
jgi:hypothetical protein